MIQFKELQEMEYEEGLKDIKTRFDYNVGLLIKKYSSLERETWTSQKTEAKLYLKTKSKDDCDMLVQIAESRGIEVEELANKIVQKSKEYEFLVAQELANKNILIKKLKDELNIN